MPGLMINICDTHKMDLIKKKYNLDFWISIIMYYLDAFRIVAMQLLHATVKYILHPRSIRISTYISIGKLNLTVLALLIHRYVQMSFGLKAFKYLHFGHFIAIRIHIVTC